MTLSLAEWLERSGAQRDVVDWARPFGADGERAWRECERGDWLLAIAVRAGVDRRAIVGAAAQCARPALDYVDRRDSRPRIAVEAAERWARSAASDEECAAAARDAEASVDASQDPVAAAAATAAFAAARSPVAPDEAAMAPAAAAEAATIAAAECASLSAFRYTHAQSADVIRAAIPWSAVAPCLTTDAGRS